MSIGIINKHNYLGEHKGKANILLSATVDDVFSITFEDEDNEVKSSWEMTMHREDAEKVIRKAAEMLGVIPKGEWTIIKSPLSNETIVKCDKCGDEFSNKIWTFYCTNCDYDFSSKCAEKEKLI